jgi:hypothetical protein
MYVPAIRIVSCHPCPEQHHRDTHYDVPADHHSVVEAVPTVDGLEHVLEPEREDDHAEHLHHHQQPAHPVVGVVRRREPRVVHPRPADGERAEQEPDDRCSRVIGRQMPRELRRRSPEPNREHQVVQQLQWCGDTQRLRRRRCARSSDSTTSSPRSVPSRNLLQPPINSGVQNRAPARPERRKALLLRQGTPVVGSRARTAERVRESGGGFSADAERS